VAPLTKIVALFEKKIWGAFWRFFARKRALPYSEPLKTLLIILVFEVDCSTLLLSGREFGILYWGGGHYL